MKLALCTILIVLLTQKLAFSDCVYPQLCANKALVISQSSSLAPATIAQIQSLTNGRIISVQNTPDGSYSVQVATPDQRVIIVSVDSNGSITHIYK